MLRLHRRSVSSAIIGVACILSLPRAPAAQVGTVRAEQKISATSGGFGGTLGIYDGFGDDVAALGDLDGDAIVDLAVGASFDDGLQGVVWILFLDADGTVKSEQRISEGVGGFGGVLEPDDFFGNSLAFLGDHDGDGVGDLAVGAWRADDGGHDQGAVWILFLNADGTVRDERKISATDGGFGGVLHIDDEFGTSIASLGDLDGDGIGDIAVGADADDDGGDAQGAAWILFLSADGTVKSEQEIGALAGGFGGDLDPRDRFGISVAALGDLDRDGTGDLAVGAFGDDDGGNGKGAVWILFLNADGTVKSEQKISATAGGFGGILNLLNAFGASLAGLGDLDGDGVPDLAAGAQWDDDGGESQGAVWILFLNADGMVKSEQQISATAGGFSGDLDPFDQFGHSVAALGDLDRDGNPDLAVGAYLDDDGSDQAGAVWSLFLEGVPCVTLDLETEDDFLEPLVNGQHLDVELGMRVTLTSSGPNAGAGIFDSTPGGPNDPSQDLDLLVDTGNLLVLQTENFPPDADDVFARPNDDADGGTLAFSFPRPVEARSVRLVDLDAAGGTSRVLLVDSSGRRRTYSVPADWTGDRTLSQPGLGTLDLATLAPQAGFGSVATAVQDAGFDGSAVVRIEVQLAGSGAVDDLAWCSPGSTAARAHATVRNGTGVNPLNLSNLAGPLVGGAWVTRLDCSGHASGFARLIVATSPVTVPTVFGEVLVGGPRLLRRIRPHGGSAVFFAEEVPGDLAMIGLAVSAQGACTGGTASLGNALDLVVGF